VGLCYTVDGVLRLLILNEQQLNVNAACSTGSPDLLVYYRLLVLAVCDEESLR
jgi:hypothetical protein